MCVHVRTRVSVYMCIHSCTRLWLTSKWTVSLLTDTPSVAAEGSNTDQGLSLASGCPVCGSTSQFPPMRGERPFWIPAATHLIKTKNIISLPVEKAFSEAFSPAGRNNCLPQNRRHPGTLESRMSSPEHRTKGGLTQHQSSLLPTAHV